MGEIRGSKVRTVGQLQSELSKAQREMEIFMKEQQDKNDEWEKIKKEGRDESDEVAGLKQEILTLNNEIKDFSESKVRLIPQSAFEIERLKAVIREHSQGYSIFSLFNN